MGFRDRAEAAWGFRALEAEAEAFRFRKRRRFRLRRFGPAARGGIPWKWSFGPEYKYKPKATDNKTPAGWLDKSKNAEDSYKTTLYDNDPNNKDKIDKYRHTMSIARVSGSGSVFDESKSKEAVRKIRAVLRLRLRHPRGLEGPGQCLCGADRRKQDARRGHPGLRQLFLGGDGMAGGFGTEDLNIHAGADVAAMKAEAKADAVLGFNEKGQFRPVWPGRPAPICWREACPAASRCGEPRSMPWPREDSDSP